MQKPRFSKEDLQREVRNMVLLQARSLSWVYDVEASHRLLGWPVPPDAASSALRELDLLDFDEVAGLDGQAADLSHLPLVQVFDQLYDYGVMGLLRDDMDSLQPGTMPAFVAAWMSDVQHSSLIDECHAGKSFEFKWARMTIALAQARAVLDGLSQHGRFQGGSASTAPNDMLSFAEVALLGDMDERSVRNAASKKDSGLVATSAEDDRKSFIKPEDARRWLAGRKGFVPTRAAGLLEHFDLFARAFTGVAEAREYLRLECERNEVSLLAYLSLCCVTDEGVTDWSRAPLPSGNAVAVVAARLGIEGDALRLRLEELVLAQRSEAIRSSLRALQREKSPLA
jgi:hypothetical protein